MWRLTNKMPSYRTWKTKRTEWIWTDDVAYLLSRVLKNFFFLFSFFFFFIREIRKKPHIFSRYVVLQICVCVCRFAIRFSCKWRKTIKRVFRWKQKNQMKFYSVDSLGLCFLFYFFPLCSFVFRMVYALRWHNQRQHSKQNKKKC